MEKIKFLIFSVITLGVLVLLGFWAFRSLEPGDIHEQRKEISKLKEENEKLLEENQELKIELTQLKPEPTETPTPTPVVEETPTTHKYEVLINELEKLSTDKVVMKEKSRGTRVGTIQTFLNVYFDTSKKVDNDFGKTTKDDLIKFQKAEGLTADGQTGPTTYEAMIDWLEKQG